MARGRSGHGGSSQLRTVPGLIAGINNLFKAIDALTGDTAKDAATEAARQRVKATCELFRVDLSVLNNLMAAVDAAVDFDLNVAPKVETAEQRLATIGNSVTAKEDHLARMLKKQDEIEAKIATRTTELQRVTAALQTYQARIAAL